MTRQGAIAAKCKECIYDPQSPGTWKEQVEACTSPKCPLFKFRPKSQKKRKTTGSSSIE